MSLSTSVAGELDSLRSIHSLVFQKTILIIDHHANQINSIKKTMPTHNDIVKFRMYDNDAFSQWLGIELVAVSKGYTTIRMTVREEMTNGFKIAHGGISYSFADSAFAFASNSWGEHAVSIETSISHTRPVHVGDVLTAVTNMENKSKRLAIYNVKVTNQDEKTVALFKGTVFHTGKEWV